METIPHPPYLEKGDTIAIVAPARSISRREISPFIRLMEQNGCRVHCSPHLFGSDRQFSGTVEQRLFDLQQAFTDPGVKAVFAARGGYGAAQLLPGMDWEVIRENPKWLVGFSDVTALHTAFGKFMQTIHGLMPFSLDVNDSKSMESFKHLLKVLQGEVPDYLVEGHPFNIPGRAEGEVTGGNLSVLYSLAGSSYEPDYEGKLLFLEDLDEYLYHVDRMVMNLELREIFRKISGLVIGSFSNMNDNAVPYGRNALEIIAERASKYQVPTLFGFPAGHEKMNFPLIFGRVGTLTVETGTSSRLKY